MSACNGEGLQLLPNAEHAKAKAEYKRENGKIDIPAGVQEGMQLNVNGKGNAVKEADITAILSYLSKKNRTKNCKEMD
jgi:molecular chaperone DnaJ